MTKFLFIPLLATVILLEVDSCSNPVNVDCEPTCMMEDLVTDYLPANGEEPTYANRENLTAYGAQLDESAINTTITSNNSNGTYEVSDYSFPDGIVENIHFTCHVKIKKSDVIMRNCIVDGLVEVWDTNVELRDVRVNYTRYVESQTGMALIAFRSGSSGTADRCTMDGLDHCETMPSCTNGFGADGHVGPVTLSNSLIFHTADGAGIKGDNVSINNNFITHLAYVPENNPWGSDASHNDCIQVLQGSNIEITNNWLNGVKRDGLPYTGQVIWLKEGNQQHVYSDILINHNYINGGTMQIGGLAPSQYSNLRIESNLFGQNCTGNIHPVWHTSDTVFGSYWVDNITCIECCLQSVHPSN